MRPIFRRGHSVWDAVPVGIWIEGLGILSVFESISVRVGKPWVRVVDGHFVYARDSVAVAVRIL